MTLVVEDGSAKADADSYADVTDAGAFIADWHDDADWNSASQARKERALRRGTRFVDERRWRGWAATADQALAWPRVRVGLVDGHTITDDVVPQAVKHATIEAALRDVQGESLFPDHDGGTIRRESKQVGSLQKSQEFATPRQAGKTFEAINALLRSYVTSGSSLPLRRAFA